jgi:hypothetical protein
VKRKARGLVYTTTVPLTPDEGRRLSKIHAILTGNGKPENVADDARHIFEAQKYGSYFVTTDGRLLKRADEIWAACGVQILRPSEFLALVQNHVRPNRR